MSRKSGRLFVRTKLMGTADAGNLPGLISCSQQLP